jgi:hypothetical protein
MTVDVGKPMHFCRKKSCAEINFSHLALRVNNNFEMFYFCDECGITPALDSDKEFNCD